MLLKLDSFEFKQCDYIGDIPSKPDLEIVKRQENPYYNKQDLFIKDGNVYHPNGRNYSFINIHESCFKDPTSIYTVARFHFNEKNDDWDLICYQHIIDFNDDEIINFRDLVKMAFNYLSNFSEE